jgi:flagellar biosynthesis/type III secretory pathway M-ring protein FliF/YscJ
MAETNTPAAAPGAAARAGNPLQQILQNRTLLIGVGVGLVVLIVLSVLVRSVATGGSTKKAPPKEVKLFTHLELKDSAAIVEILKEKKVKDYKLEDGGTTIVVPGAQEDELRLELATEGYPVGSGVGFEIFDKGGQLGATDFDKRIKLTRAISGELSRNISRITGVEEARVQIVMPEKQLFSSTQVETTAAVFLRLASSYNIPPESVTGIIHLVSSSVEGLNTRNVTVVDYTGRILSDQKYDEWYQASITAHEAPTDTNVPLLQKLLQKDKPKPQVSSPVKKLDKLELYQKRLSEQLQAKADEVLAEFFPPDSYFIKVVPLVMDQGELADTEIKPQLGQLNIQIMLDESNAEIKLTPVIKDSVFKGVAAATGYVRGRDQISLSYVSAHQLLRERNLISIKKPSGTNIIPKDINIPFKPWMALAAGGVIALLYLRSLWMRRRKKVSDPAILTSTQSSRGEDLQAGQMMREMAMQNPDAIAKALARWFEEDDE